MQTTYTNIQRAQAVFAKNVMFSNNTDCATQHTMTNNEPTQVVHYSIHCLSSSTKKLLIYLSFLNKRFEPSSHIIFD